MGRPLSDLTGQTFGLLTVVKRGDVKQVPTVSGGNSRWWVQCKCGSPPFQVWRTNLFRIDAEPKRDCGCQKQVRKPDGTFGPKRRRDATVAECRAPMIPVT